MVPQLAIAGHRLWECRDHSPVLLWVLAQDTAGRPGLWRPCGLQSAWETRKHWPPMQLLPGGTWERVASQSSLLTGCSGGRRGLHADDVWLAGPPLLLSCSLKCAPPTPVLGLVCLVGLGVDFYPNSNPPGLWKTLHHARSPAPSNGSWRDEEELEGQACLGSQEAAWFNLLWSHDLSLDPLQRGEIWQW
jgi:hypothetical protein